MVSKVRLVGMVLILTVSTPIWLYLIYKILKAINASELTWFLFIIYIPVQIIIGIILGVTDYND